MNFLQTEFVPKLVFVLGIINLLSGLLVLFTESKYPDLIVGSIVFVIVIKGGLRILKLGAPANLG